MKSRFWIESWDKFLLMLFSLLGAGLFSSGVVTWIASNWYEITKFEKLFVTQGLLVALVGESLYLLRRANSKNKVTLLWFVAAVVIGGLLALIGQIYQTGADTWQLFALWSLLQLPFWLVLPNVAGILLWVATTNVALSLFFSVHWHFSFFFYDRFAEPLTFILLFNLVLLACFEYFAARFYDPWRIVVRVVSLLVAACIIYLSIINVEIQVLGLFLTSGLLWFYVQRKFDALNYVLFFCTLVAVLDILIVQSASDIGSITVVAFLTVMAVGFLGLQLTRWIKENYAHVDNNIGVTLLYFFLGLLALGLMLLVLVLHGMDSELPIFIVACILCVFGFLLKSKWDNPLLSAISFALGIAAALLYGELSYSAFSYFGEYYGDDNAHYSLSAMRLDVLLLLAFYLVSYWASRAIWVRAFAVYALLWLLARFYPMLIHFHLFMLISLLAFYFSAKHHPKQMKSLAYGLLLFLLFEYAKFAVQLVSEFLVADALPEIASFSDFVRVITNGVFEAIGLDLGSILMVLVMLSPALLFMALNRQHTDKPNLMVLCGIVLFCFLFSGNAWLCYFLSLLLLAYHNHDRALFGTNILLTIVFLGFYYYWLEIPLLYKSFLLLSGGVMFSLLAIRLYWRTRKAQQAVTSAQNFANKPQWLAALFVLVSTLGLANYAVVQNEDILRNGQPIVLRLAPVDPRSLMQGDYMALNYALMNELNWQVGGLDELRTKRKLYVLLNLQANNVASICRVESEVPRHFAGCEEGIYLPTKSESGFHFVLPSHQFFFPEGMAAHYQQAAYGEFRFKHGKVLLSRLLNEKFVEL